MPEDSRRFPRITVKGLLIGSLGALVMAIAMLATASMATAAIPLL